MTISGVQLAEYIELMFEADFSTDEALEGGKQIIERDGLIPLPPEDLRVFVESVRKRHRLKALSLKKRFSAEELMQEDLPPLRFMIDRILPEGLTLLAGKPKTGKTFLALQLATDVADRRKVFDVWPTSSGTVIYYALEDGFRRIQDRLKKILRGRKAPRNLHILTELPRLDNGGLNLLEEEVKRNSGVCFVIIDTFAAVRPHSSRGKKSFFEEDYSALKGPQTLANKYGFSVLVVHHMRKGEASDRFDQVSGTLGLNAAVDNIWILGHSRGRADAVLQVTGRDLEEGEWVLNFKRDLGQWKLAEGAPEDYQRTTARQAIIEVIRRAKIPLGPKDVAKEIKKSDQAVRKLMTEMAKSGELQKSDRGKYHIPGNIPHLSNIIHNGHFAHDGNEGNKSEYVSFNPETFVDIGVVSDVTTD